MANTRIAVLFDAENINCDTAQRVLEALAARGTIQIKKAVGDFSATNLAKWVGCSTEHGIELVFQPSLGKGKNTADIRLTIEAMDIAYQRGIDTVALVTRDRDFAPLAHRLRHAGIAVWGYAESEPNVAFRAACSSFEVVAAAQAASPVAKPVSPKPVAKIAVKPAAKPEAKVAVQPAPRPLPVLDAAAVARLRQISIEACQEGPIPQIDLNRAIIAAAPDLATQLSGSGLFFRTLLANGIVERVGEGALCRYMSHGLKRAS